MNHMIKTQFLPRQLNTLCNRDIWTEAPKHTSKSHRSNANPRAAVDNKQRVQTNYEILGISPKASQKEIKTAYYSLSKTCHPDVNKSSEAAVQFREITDAYDVLSNKESKRVYDSSIGNHFERKIYDNSEVNQQNLDRYREFGRFRENKFTDSEDYLSQKWKKRRNMQMEQKYRDIRDEENKNKYRYVDPLNYDPKTYYSKHFNEDLQKKFAEEIEKENERFTKVVQEFRSEMNIKVFVLVILFTIPFIFGVLEPEPNSTHHNKSKLIEKNNSKPTNQ